MPEFQRVVNPNGNVGMVPVGSDAHRAYELAPSTKDVFYDEYGVPIPGRKAEVDTYDVASGTRLGDEGPQMPSATGTKAAWVAYATSPVGGMTAEEADAYTRDDLAKHYLTDES